MSFVGVKGIATGNSYTMVTKEKLSMGDVVTTSNEPGYIEKAKVDTERTILGTVMWAEYTPPPYIEPLRKLARKRFKEMQNE